MTVVEFEEWVRWYCTSQYEGLKYNDTNFHELDYNVADKIRHVARATNQSWKKYDV